MQFPKEPIQLIARVIGKNGWIDLPARGTSMYPFIREGDVCRFVLAEPASIRKGDILLYHTPYGSLVAHRFCHIVASDHQLQYLCKGDSNLAHDEAIAMEQLLGKMAWIKRNGRIIRVTGLAASMWGRAVLLFPMISLFVRLYLNRKESVQG